MPTLTPARFSVQIGRTGSAVGKLVPCRSRTHLDHDLRRAGWQRPDLDIGKHDLSTKAGAKRLHDRFLGRETSGEAIQSIRPVPGGNPLALAKASHNEVACWFVDQAPQALQIHQVDAVPDDFHTLPQPRSRPTYLSKGRSGYQDLQFPNGNFPNNGETLGGGYQPQCLRS